MRVPSGAAIGWNIRCAITPSVRADWDVQEPQGLVWRPACSLWESGSGVTAAVLDALREEIAGMAGGMGQVGVLLKKPPLKQLSTRSGVIWVLQTARARISSHLRWWSPRHFADASAFCAENWQGR